MKTPRLLLIKENGDLSRNLTPTLKQQGYRVESGEGAIEGYQRALEREYDFIVLSLPLKGSDSWEMCRYLGSRNGDFYTPFLILSSQSAEVDRVLGLELGADDYLVKPFSMMEFLARIKAILRRIQMVRSRAAEGPSRPLQRGELTIDQLRYRAVLDGRELELRVKEFELLAKLAIQPGRVFTRDQLLDSVWGYDFKGYEHTVDSHIHRLRKKLEPAPAKPHYVLTVRGVGYKFSERYERGPSPPTVKTNDTESSKPVV